MSRFSESKRASITDILVMIIILFTVAMTVMFAYKIMGGIRAQLAVNPQVSAAALAVYDKPYNAFPNTFDKVFLLLYVGLLLASLIGAWYVDVHPVFFVISLFLLIFFMIVAGVVNNVYATMMQNSNFSSFESQFPIINLFMGNLIGVMVITSALIMIALFAKPKEAAVL